MWSPRIDHPLRRKSKLRLADTMNEQWAIPPRGTAPYEHMQQVFRAHGLGCRISRSRPRSITALKSLVTRSGFLGWMANSFTTPSGVRAW